MNPPRAAAALLLLAVLVPAAAVSQPPPPHATHATPPGWKFRWPAGDAARGRQLFARLECHACHEVKGERFPAPDAAGSLGPELSAMGPLHEAEYFAEAIVNPSAVVEPGRGYEAADGSSRMPSYNDTLTVQDVADLVAFLRALRPPAGEGHPAHH